MRTTLTIDDDVLAAAKSLAATRSIPLGRALSELARRGCRGSSLPRHVRGFAVFEPPDGAPPLDEEAVRGALEQDDLKRYGESFR
jgi:hypothetical protein